MLHMESVLLATFTVSHHGHSCSGLYLPGLSGYFTGVGYGTTVKSRAHDIVATKPYELDLLGTRSFIATHTCMVCNRYVENARWFTSIPPDRKRYIVSCHHYHCQVSSIYSMVGDLASMHVHVLQTTLPTVK